MKNCQIIILNKYQIGATGGILIAGYGILVEFDHDGFVFKRKWAAICAIHWHAYFVCINITAIMLKI